MNTQKLTNIIISQRKTMDTFFKENQIIDREILKINPEKYLEYPNILAITGIRRSGKSILGLFLLKEKKYGYINFFDERLANFTSEDFEILISAFYEIYGNIDYFIFDEIQRIKGWQLFVSRFRINKKIIITGSNSELLGSNLAKYLTGRYVELKLYPLSFREYLKIKNIDYNNIENLGILINELNNYMDSGGFPEVYKIGTIIINTIFHDIVENDIIYNKNIKNNNIREVADYLVSNSGNEISINNIKNNFQIKDLHTLTKYINYIENSYLIIPIKKFSFKFKEQFKAKRKYFCVDTGLINYASFKINPDKGKLMENIVLIELLRLSFLKNYELYYWKDYNDHEIDFIIKQKEKIIKMINVTYASSFKEVKQREIISLNKGLKELKCDNMEIITWDFNDAIEKNGYKIKYTSLLNFLLKDDIIE